MFPSRKLPDFWLHRGQLNFLFICQMHLFEKKSIFAYLWVNRNGVQATRFFADQSDIKGYEKG